MGRRSINTTKSGKYMNPTDQARKEARKRELKKNKKQRMAVRQAVLKGKDPLRLLEEMEVIDKMEYDPTQPPRLNEKVLKDKRKKLKETFDRVIRMYEKEDPEYSMELRKMSVEHDKKRTELQIYFEQVKNAERVQLDQIPLPDAPDMQAPSQIPLPSDIPMPAADNRPLHSILKKAGAPPGPPPGPPPLHAGKRKPAGPPLGPPPVLSDSEEEMFVPRQPVIQTLSEDAMSAASLVSTNLTDIQPPAAKSRKIRFKDDDSHDPDEPEKDTRLKYKGPVTSLQAKMLKMAGQQMPVLNDRQKADLERARKREAERQERRSRNRKRGGSSSSSDSDSDSEEERRRRRRERRRRRSHSSSSSSSSDGEREQEKRSKWSDIREESLETETSTTTKTDVLPPVAPPGAPPGLPPDGTPLALPSSTGVPPGPPPGLPPGPPPGLPPMVLRAPAPRVGPTSVPPRMLPPGPPPGRPPGMPPGPPPGLPPSMRAPPPRMPPGLPPPRMLRPPGAPPGVPPPGGVGFPVNPNILSAPPSIMKLPLKTSEEKKKNLATIEAKPQIKHVIGDVTRFMPTALKVKRELKDAKGRVIKTSGKVEEQQLVTTKNKKPAVQAQTKDDAYDAFMKEMEDLF